MSAGAGHGVAVWSTAAWQRGGAGLDRPAARPPRRERTAASRARRSCGRGRRCSRCRPTRGTVWFKADGPGTAFEVGLYGLLARVAPDRVLTPLARGHRARLDPAAGRRADARRAPRRAPSGRRARPMRWCEYGRAAATARAARRRDARARGRRHAPGGDAAAVRRGARGGRRRQRGRDDAEGLEVLERIAPLRPRVAGWCERLAESPLPASLDHNDLHPWNVLGDGGATSATTTGATAWSPIRSPRCWCRCGFVQRDLEAELADPRFVAARDAYLEGSPTWRAREDSPRRSSSPAGWRRSPGCSPGSGRSRAAREQGEEIDPNGRPRPARDSRRSPRSPG